MLRSVLIVSRLLTMGGVDLIVFLAACLVGMLVQFYLPVEPWFIGIGVLLSYHLFLAWLLVNSDQTIALGRNTFSSLLTHLACLAVVYCVAWSAQAVGKVSFFTLIPGFSLLGYGAVMLCLQERRFLLTGQKKSEPLDKPAPSAPDISLSGEDYEEFLHYLANRNPTSLKPGTSVTTEYTQWRVARARSRSSVAVAK